MKIKPIYKNTIYAFLLQFTTLLYPLVTSPYISRVIGAENIGKINFSSSVINGFSVLALFGTTTYGVREVSRIRDDREKLSLFFSEIMLIKVIANLATIALYLASIRYIAAFSKEGLLFCVQGVTLLLNIFSLDWFFQGLENYRFIALRSLLFKGISLAALFLFIRSGEDYILYAGISVFGVSFSNILNFIYSLKFISVKTSGLCLKRHMKPLRIFLVSTVVIGIYLYLDSVILGFFKGNTDVALYTRARMVLTVGTTTAVTVSNAVMPRINNCFLFNKEKYAELLGKTADIIILISMPIMIGMSVLSRYIMLLLGGSEFLPSARSFVVMSPLVVIIPMVTWNYHQRMLPRGYEKTALYSSCIMAAVSIAANTAATHFWGFMGCTASYVLVESLGAVICFAYMHGRDSYVIFKAGHVKYIISSVLMGLLLYEAGLRIRASWLSLFAEVTVGAVVYFVLLVLMRDSIVLSVLRSFKVGKRFILNQSN